MISNSINNENFDERRIESLNEKHKIFKVHILKSKNIWTLEEDHLLKKLVNKYGTNDWYFTAKFFKKKSAAQCSIRYKRILRGVKKIHWTADEDKKVKELISVYGMNWRIIAKFLPSRTGKQIRERYLNILNPNICYRSFTKDEDDLVYLLQKKLGNKWKDFSKYFNKRSPDMIKNRYYTYVKFKINDQCIKEYNFCIQNIIENLSKEKDHLENISHLRNLLKILLEEEKYINKKNAYYFKHEEHSNCLSFTEKNSNPTCSDIDNNHHSDSISNKENFNNKENLLQKNSYYKNEGNFLSEPINKKINTSGSPQNRVLPSHSRKISSCNEKSANGLFLDLSSCKHEDSISLDSNYLSNQSNLNLSLNFRNKLVNFRMKKKRIFHESNFLNKKKKCITKRFNGTISNYDDKNKIVKINPKIKNRKKLKNYKNFTILNSKKTNKANDSNIPKNVMDLSRDYINDENSAFSNNRNPIFYGNNILSQNISAGFLIEIIKENLILTKNKLMQENFNMYLNEKDSEIQRMMLINKKIYYDIWAELESLY